MMTACSIAAFKIYQEFGLTVLLQAVALVFSVAALSFVSSVAWYCKSNSQSGASQLGEDKPAKQPLNEVKIFSSKSGVNKLVATLPINDDSCLAAVTVNARCGHCLEQHIHRYPVGITRDRTLRIDNFPEFLLGHNLLGGHEIRTTHFITCTRCEQLKKEI